MKNEKKVTMGKQSKAAGGQFELRVRKDLEDKGFIVDKWTNNIEFLSPFEAAKYMLELTGSGIVTGLIGKMVPAKPAYGFNPRLKMRVPLTRSTGFPDFIAFVHDSKMHVSSSMPTWVSRCKPFDDNIEPINPRFALIGVESKLTGDLDRAEKEKCKWLLDNNIFSKILIAEKTKVKNKVVIVYHDFKEKYWRFYE